jgi:hypothetical protein
MTSENNNPERQQIDDSNAAEIAEREQINRIANELAGRAMQREFRFDDEHNIFIK